MNSGLNEGEKKPNQVDRYHAVKLPSDYDNSSWFGKFTFIWQWRFFLRHHKKEFGLKDLPKPRAKDEADYVHNEFLGYWQAEVERARKRNRQPNLIYPIFQQYGLRAFFMFIFCFLNSLTSVSQSFYLGDIIKYFNDLNEGKEGARWEIAKVCIAIFVLAVISKNTKNAFNVLSLMTSLRVRVCLSELVYRKALRLSRGGFVQTSTGQIINHLTVDMNRIDNFWKMLPYPFVGFALLVYVIARLWRTLGHFTFYGLLFLVIVIPIQSYIGRMFSKMRLKAAEYTDERIRLVDEFLNAIKIIKLYCWEYPFAEKINEARKKEIAKLKESLHIFAITLGLFASTTKIIVFIILLIYYLWFNSVTDQLVFLTLSVFNQTTFIITIFIPEMVMATSNFLISIGRINRFLALEESAGDGVYHSTSDGKEYALSFKNLTACVLQPLVEKTVKKSKISDQNKKANGKPVGKEVKGDEKSVNILKNIDFKCKPGELVIVVGAVGCSKTSLLQAILSELQIKEGHITVNGRLAYAPQDAWIFGGTIRENILFDSEFDETRYNEVLRVCALERDLSLFEDGDRTLIGEKGISLSGGQKARIGLARALYFNAEILLLDDPLSAVDAHVSKHIFKQAISEYLKSKTVLLCTHQLNYVKYADKVLFLKNGEQVFFESTEELTRRLINEPEGEFAKFIGSSLGEESSDAGSRRSSLSTESISCGDEEDKQNQKKEIEKMVKEKRIKDEDAKLSFLYKSYLSYFKYGRIALTGPLLILVFGLAQLNATSLDYFLKLWTDSIAVSSSNNFLNMTDNSTALLLPASTTEISSFRKFIVNDGVYVYLTLIVCFFVLGMARVMSLAMFCMRVSVKIHKSLFDRIVRANMKFFYTNPVGIILNRFSRDTSIIDDSLWSSLNDLVEVVVNDVVIFAILAISNPILIIPFTLFILAVIWYRMFYITTARALQTLEGVSKSPQVEQLASTLNGMSTVRAFRREKKFIEKFDRFQNDYSACRFTLMVCKRWFVYVLEHLQLIFLAGTLFALVMLAEKFSGSLVGFILTNILYFNTEFQWGVQCWANLEQYLCSVDRIEAIGKKLDPSSKKGKALSLSEPPLESAEGCKPPSDWPQRGVIEFRNVTLRYFQNEAPALNNLNFTVRAQEKVGIVGRTGAGKSSILAALFRLSEFEGEIIIDGINCKSIGLHDLRGNISIIPQESILFTGTVRVNLDPLHEYEDRQLWNALRSVQLEHAVKELEGGLDSTVMDNGSNFSVGQKQLICLARAILKESKILVLDEATANTDPATDELIQATIRNVFRDCTILTIAHRINTIIDCHRILVMDAGEAKEFDTPKRLLANSNSIFSSMVDAYGEEQSRNLRRLVEQQAI